MQPGNHGEGQKTQGGEALLAVDDEKLAVALAFDDESAQIMVVFRAAS